MTCSRNADPPSASSICPTRRASREIYVLHLYSPYVTSFTPNTFTVVSRRDFYSQFRMCHIHTSSYTASLDAHCGSF